MKRKETSKPSMLNTIAEFAVEEYRFMRTYISAVSKLYDEEKKRYISAYAFHESKVYELLDKFELRALFFDGQDYDEGLPVTPLNLEEFDIADQLIVEQTFDPAIISNGNIVRQGTVILARKEINEKK